jgi:hypothetical protein
MPKTPSKPSKKQRLDLEMKEVTFKQVMEVTVTVRTHGRERILYYHGRPVDKDGTVGEEIVMKGMLEDASLDKNTDTYMLRATDPNSEPEFDTRMAVFFKLEHKVETHVPETAGSLTEAENETEWTTVLSFPEPGEPAV